MKNVATYLNNFLTREKRGLNFFSPQVTKEIFEPDDYCRKARGEKEAVYRMLNEFLAQHKFYDASMCLNYLLENYYINISFLWKAGLQILNEIGSPEQIEDFYSTLITLNFPDYHEMFYEYCLYLISVGNYQEVNVIYNHLDVQKKLTTKNEEVSKSSREKVLVLIKLVVAQVSYCLWKISQNTMEDTSHLDNAEAYFRNIITLINNGEIVDNFIINYIDVLQHKCNFQVAYEILLLYKEKCSFHFNPLRYLLLFVSDNRDILTEVNDDDVKKWRLEYVQKMIHMNPNEDPYTVQMLKECIDDLASNEELLVGLLFEVLLNKEWLSTAWPWVRLAQCIESLGVDHEEVQHYWKDNKSYWIYEYFPHSDSYIHIKNIALLLGQE